MIEIWRQISLTPLASGFCLGEGPRWFEGLLWFSDPPGGAVHTVNLSGATSTLPLPGHAPSGLGFRPDGSLLIASTESRRILRYDGEIVSTEADLSHTVPANLGGMVVDELGRAYVGCQVRGGVIVRIDPDGSQTVVAEELDIPSGMGITSDGESMIVAESGSRRLTAFAVSEDGALSDRRIFADGLAGPPNGIALDVDGGVWTSMTAAHQFLRVLEGGRVTDRVDMAGRSANACTLGGPQRRTLFLLSSTQAGRQRLTETKSCRVDAVMVDIPGAGLPQPDKEVKVATCP
ncbi:SMP-30/gluconolactonase/LRE family protein [Mycobacterium sp. SMC-2]|uniref:SMP-30/gluconolactonase/LRE family protein n=1 Tax=Mycobacterium sp. SMC-2 TaxID=2857058 RepID=UPI0037C74D08